MVAAQRKIVIRPHKKGMVRQRIDLLFASEILDGVADLIGISSLGIELQILF